MSSINDGRRPSEIETNQHLKALKGRNTEKTNNMGQSIVKNYIANQKEHHG